MKWSGAARSWLMLVVVIANASVPGLRCPMPWNATNSNHNPALQASHAVLYIQLAFRFNRVFSPAGMSDVAVAAGLSCRRSYSRFRGGGTNPGL